MEKHSTILTMLKKLPSIIIIINIIIIVVVIDGADVPLC